MIYCLTQNKIYIVQSNVELLFFLKEKRKISINGNVEYWWEKEEQRMIVWCGEMIIRTRPYTRKEPTCSPILYQFRWVLITYSDVTLDGYWPISDPSLFKPFHFSHNHLSTALVIHSQFYSHTIILQSIYHPLLIKLIRLII